VLSTEPLSGPTLSEHIAVVGRLSTVEAFPLVMQIAAGLDAAHVAGVIHRDFKSNNIILLLRLPHTSRQSGHNRFRPGASG